MCLEWEAVVVNQVLKDTFGCRGGFNAASADLKTCDFSNSNWFRPPLFTGIVRAIIPNSGDHVLSYPRIRWWDMLQEYPHIWLVKPWFPDVSVDLFSINQPSKLKKCCKKWPRYRMKHQIRNLRWRTVSGWASMMWTRFVPSCASPSLMAWEERDWQGWGRGRWKIHIGKRKGNTWELVGFNGIQEWRCW